MEKIVSRLDSSSEKKRESAHIALLEHPPGEVIPAVARLVLGDVDSVTQGACLDLLEQLGAVVTLDEARTDGWFDRLGEKISNFEIICSLMGARFLAYSIILGIQIRSLSRDPRVPANTTVEFANEDSLPQTLTIGEFRSRVVHAMLQRESFNVPPAELPVNEDIAVASIGEINMLLAPLFDISIRHFVWLPPGDGPRALIGFFQGEGFDLRSLEEFVSLLRQKLHRDLAGTHEEPFQLDLSAVEDARAAAAQGDHGKVISFLENWPGLLATLQRTPVMHQLTQAQLSTIAEGLVLLGNSFKGKKRLTWAEELYRLGLQFVREGEWGARLFMQLGILLNETERHGEAIGFLRRAQALGAEDGVVSPYLARSFLRRGKVVAAALLIRDAMERGVESDLLEADLAETRRELARAKVSWPTV